MTSSFLKFVSLALSAVALLISASTPCLSQTKTASPKSPLTPAEERATFRLADDSLRVELVVAEPDIVSPVAIAWDANGAMFVVEMLGYPLAPNSGKIKRLEDRNGDGRYERVTVFADQLNFPNGVMPYRDGILVTAAPDILYLRDTDHDGVADERTVLWTGFREGNQQLRVNGLFWGIDNWIYGANGRSGGKVRSASDANSPTVSLDQNDFRFHPSDGRFQAIVGMSQFGLGHDDWGNRFTTLNHRFARQVILESHHIQRNPQLIQHAIFDTNEPGDDRRVHYIGQYKPMFNQDQGGYFTSLSGLNIYRGNRLGAQYTGDAFAGESAQNVVIHRNMDADGVTFTARRANPDVDFLASTDSWFHPVNFATGPDGALYIVDFYRELVEHPQWAHDDKSEGVDWRVGEGHGRIWRVVKKGDDVAWWRPLGHETTTELVHQMQSPVSWVRETAQRLIVERQDFTAVPRLRQTLESDEVLARLHAMWTLEGLGQLRDDSVLMMLKDEEPRLRVHAVRIAETRFARTTQPESVQMLRDAVVAMTGDDDARVRYQVGLTLGALSPDEALPALIALARSEAEKTSAANPGNELESPAADSDVTAGQGSAESASRNVMPDARLSDTTLAVLSSAAPVADELLTTLLQDAETTFDSQRLKFYRELGALASSQVASLSDDEVIDWLLQLEQRPERSLGDFASLVGISEGLARHGKALRGLFSQSAPLREKWAGSFQRAGHLAANDESLESTRRMAIGLLAQGTAESAGGFLFESLAGVESDLLRADCVLAIADINDRGLSERLFGSVDSLTGATRREVLQASVRSAAMAAALVRSLEAGDVQPTEVPEDVRLGLQKLEDERMRDAAERLLAATVSNDRQAVVDRYRSALKMVGDHRQGAKVFKQNCITCHSIAGLGGSTGPDLSRMKTRSDEALLVSILDPSREVSYELKTFIVLTADGRLLTGIITSDTPDVLTIRSADGRDHTVLRDQIEERSATGRSIMPDGFERNIDQQALADLIAFLKQPNRNFLTAAVAP